MGELISGTVAQVAGGVVLSAGSRGLRWLRLAGRFEASWLDLADDLVGQSLTAPEIADIEQFLRSTSVRPILSLLAVSLLGPSLSSDDKTLDVIRVSFIKAAQKWNVDSPEKWLESADLVWTRIVELLDTAFAALKAEKTNDEASQFSRFVKTPLMVRKRGDELTDYLARIVDLASDIDRLGALEELYSSLLERTGNRQPPPILTHTDVDTAADFAHLYIPRVIYRSDGAEESSETLMGNGLPYRIVLTGAPGAGKTTFVSHLVYALSGSEDVPRITLAVRCRDYLREGWHGSLVDYMARLLERTLDVIEDADKLRDLLLMGRVELIIDGLDEIADIPARVEMVQRIEALCRVYPSMSVLVTSRELGYQRASLDERLFQHYRLKEFTDPQVAEYAARWFSLVDRQELTDPFIVESQTVTDLRCNPLLLSLLCILYRARGSIPRKRRDIYAKCAELLFLRWDAHRGISQPEDMPAYGERLMQEIARWVYKSKAAQAGLEEKVITKAIGGYLASIAGIDEFDAKSRAAEFLEFCAGRAWLLAKIGTSEHGERIFGFSHRTFLEYFTAESLCRAAPDAKSVADHIITAFRADPTSVLPELLVQAYDDKEDGGGWRVFEDICQRGGNSGLPIRLMDGTLLPQRSRKLAFDMLCDDWDSPRRRMRLETFVALLNLNRDARSHFISDYLHDNRTAQMMFMSGWASLELIDEAGFFKDEWTSEVRNLRKLASSSVDDFASDSVCKSWLALSEYAKEVTEADAAGLLVARGRFGACLGASWWIVERHLFGEPVSEAQYNLLKRWIRSAISGQSIDNETAMYFAAFLRERLDKIRIRDRSWACESEAVKEALLTMYLLQGEYRQPSSYLERLVSECYGFDITLLLSRRRASARKRDWREIERRVPGWVNSWCREDITLIYELRGRSWDPIAGQWVTTESEKRRLTSEDTYEGLEDGWDEPELTERDLDLLAERAAQDHLEREIWESGPAAPHEADEEY
ncbi:NACHT domain-containing protein [Kribbella pratensis]|uniref:NACHT domain-containing protein n=1 Tax=Kribbella pratensis TaxID=2512112 RepID=A0A4R8CKQ7_9ACTN|nr:NACHT domain-containing protein [Kribbella pratensis]TDW76473.1 NACHT domain-containing protein [Kribbella pratensis]